MSPRIIAALKRILRTSLRTSEFLTERTRIKFRPYVLIGLQIISRFPEKMTFPVRIFLAGCLPWDPLYSSTQTSMSVFLLTTSKDLDVLPFALESVIQNIALTDSSITIVAPQECLPKIKMRLEDLYILENISTKSDEAILAEFGLERKQFPTGHSLMQVIKFLSALSSTTEDSIVVDGDTIFLKNRVWATRDKVVLVVPPEYQTSHVRFVETYFSQISHSNLGFTTQAQVMRRAWVREMFEAFGGLNSVVDSFTCSMNKYLSGESETVFPCEWQLLGDWLYTFKHDSIDIASFLNFSENRALLLPPSDLPLSLEFIRSWISGLKNDFQVAGSVSMHAYKSPS